MAWFAVKTFYRMRAVGRPRSRNRHYVPGVVAIEERIVLFRARNARAALEKGEAEGDSYAGENGTTNVFGQRVVVERLRYIEAFAMFNEPAHGAEVFSAIEMTARGESARHIIRRKVGRNDVDTMRTFVSARITEGLNRTLGEEWSAGA